MIQCNGNTPIILNNGITIEENIIKGPTVPIAEVPHNVGELVLEHLSRNPEHVNFVSFKTSK